MAIRWFLLLLGMNFFIGFFLPWGEHPVFYNWVEQYLGLNLPEGSSRYIHFVHTIALPLMMATTSIVVLLLMRSPCGKQ